MSESLDEFGRSDLHYAARDGDLEKVRRLINAGSDVHRVDHGGWSPLHFAAQACSAETAEILIEAGARIDVRDSHGNTPLWRAVMESRGDGSVIAVLRRAGADPFLENNSGVSPLTLARRIGNYDLKQFFSDLNEYNATL
jgi:ankyrin repeat protein